MNKHLGINDSLDAAHSTPATHEAKALSPNCHMVVTESFDIPRIHISEEEADIINSGGNDCQGWEKITL